jgi:hypothetical protein
MNLKLGLQMLLVSLSIKGHVTQIITRVDENLNFLSKLGKFSHVPFSSARKETDIFVINIKS